MRSLRAQMVLMVGADLALPGGINAVVKSYRATGLLERWHVRYVVSYRGKSAVTQFRSMTVALLQVLGLLATGRVRLVHVHSASRGSFWRKSLFCGMSWVCRVPYVFHLHNGEFPGFYRDECGPLVQRWVRWVLRHASCVAVLTPGWLAAIRLIEPGAAARVLVNPVDLSATPGATRALARRVLFLGRILEKKGVFDLVAAMPAVLALFPKVRFCLAGDGDLNEVRKRAEVLGVTQSLELPGWIDGARKEAEMADADVLVLPSYFEGLPICVLEAMAAGVPVVATPVGGVGFALDEGRCGILAPVGAPAQLAAALNGLLGDPARRRSIAMAARERAELCFGAARVSEAVSALWQECAGAPNNAPASRDMERQEP